jgi:hypothetical protein
LIDEIGKGQTMASKDSHKGRTNSRRKSKGRKRREVDGSVESPTQQSPDNHSKNCNF